jgi:hypothetical protein
MEPQEEIKDPVLLLALEMEEGCEVSAGLDYGYHLQEYLRSTGVTEE